jgi:hypothetical protein
LFSPNLARAHETRNVDVREFFCLLDRRTAVLIGLFCAGRAAVQKHQAPKEAYHLSSMRHRRPKGREDRGRRLCAALWRSQAGLGIFGSEAWNCRMEDNCQRGPTLRGELFFH